jgi:hypothetical protein
MVALLFLFMQLTTDDTHGAVAIDRPHASNAAAHPHALREDSLHLTITRDGKFFFSGTGGTYQARISIEEVATPPRRHKKGPLPGTLPRRGRPLQILRCKDRRRPTPRRWNHQHCHPDRKSPDTLNADAIDIHPSLMHNRTHARGSTLRFLEGGSCNVEQLQI